VLRFGACRTQPSCTKWFAAGVAGCLRKHRAVNFDGAVTQPCHLKRCGQGGVDGFKCVLTRLWVSSLYTSCNLGFGEGIKNITL
jgi:hypothetical protein